MVLAMVFSGVWPAAVLDHDLRRRLALVLVGTRDHGIDASELGPVMSAGELLGGGGDLVGGGGQFGGPVGDRPYKVSDSDQLFHSRDSERNPKRSTVDPYSPPGEPAS